MKADILENSGPSMRDTELDDLNRKLSAENLKVFINIWASALQWIGRRKKIYFHN